MEDLLRRFQQEALWLAAHREEYAGKWVALNGDSLLASGETASEVFGKIRGLCDCSLVTRVDVENVPFGGW